MTFNELSLKEPAGKTALIFVLVGLALLALSVAVPEHDYLGYVRTFLRELGIVVLTVFTVSVLYEMLVEEKHFQKVTDQINYRLAQGEGLLAACLQLGIDEVFPRRDVFELKYPFKGVVDDLHPGASLSVLARSLFGLMTKAPDIQKAVERGATLRLCVFDPHQPPEDISKIQGMVVADVVAAVTVFKKAIAEWVGEAQPPGTVELRFHRFPIADSLLTVSSNARSQLVWDLSFARDIGTKRIILLDPHKGLGQELHGRIEHVWAHPTTKVVFRYSPGKIEVNSM